MKKYLTRTSIFILGSFPVYAFGATRGFKEVLLETQGVIDKLVVMVVGVALFAFFWGLTKTIFGAGDVEKQAAGRNIMKYGILALFIMVSIWSIIGFLQQGFGINNSTSNSSLNSNNASSDGCTDAFGNPTYTGDCGTF
ncbi:MAG: hypothetical protein WAV25_01785 [Minisyncoccia bacterium]